MGLLHQQLSTALKQRQQDQIIRSIAPFDVSNSIDFASNDYLGFAQSQDLEEEILRQYNLQISLNKTLRQRNGSTGSRLLSGNTQFVVDLEEELARFYHRQHALIFNSGYDANLGILSCLPQHHDVIFYDDYSHISTIEGLRLSRGQAIPFQHNNVRDLRARIQTYRNSNQTNNLFIAVEGVYSMDGDFAPLKELAEICATWNCYMIVDEAHSTGVYGPNGAGCVAALNLQPYVLCSVHTFGKAMGIHGAVMVCDSDILKQYVINYSRPFIYSTSLPLHSLISVQCSHRLCFRASSEREHLQSLIKYFQLKCHEFRSNPSYHFRPSSSHIQALYCPSNASVTTLAKNLLDRCSIHCYGIRWPSVPKGTQRLRLILHAFNTLEQLDELFNGLQVLIPEVPSSKL